MGFTTGHMGLRVWNQLTDLYDHAQLADNFVKLDYHDHAPGRGVQIGTDGIMDGAITPVKLSSALDAHSALAYPRQVIRTGATLAAAAAAGTYAMNVDARTEALIPGSAAGTAHYLIFSNQAVTGKTVKCTLGVSYLTNATDPGTGFTFAMAPATLSPNGTGFPTISSVGAAVGSIAISPGASASGFNSTVFAAPANGWYAITVTTTAPMATGASATLTGTLSLHTS